jgi:Ala-tRNA(Pro) deacylase
VHDLEQRLKARLQAAGLPSPGKLSFASPERMERFLGLAPGSVSPFGLINDADHHVIFFLDASLSTADTLSFPPNDCRGNGRHPSQRIRSAICTRCNRWKYMRSTDAVLSGSRTGCTRTWRVGGATNGAMATPFLHATATC